MACLAIFVHPFAIVFTYVFHIIYDLHDCVCKIWHSTYSWTEIFGLGWLFSVIMKNIFNFRFEEQDLLHNSQKEHERFFFFFVKKRKRKEKIKCWKHWIKEPRLCNSKQEKCVLSWWQCQTLHMHALTHVHLHMHALTLAQAVILFHFKNVILLCIAISIFKRLNI